MSDLVEYQDYINSNAWRKVRQRYFESNMPQVCFACNLANRPGFHLHHKTYRRLGKEKLTDLMLLCPDCHSKIHKIHAKKKHKIPLWYLSHGFIKSQRLKRGLSPDIYRAEKPKK